MHCNLPFLTDWKVTGQCCCTIMLKDFCFQVKMVEQGLGYLIFGSLVTASLALLPYCFRLAQKLDVANLSSVSFKELPTVAIGPPCALSYAFFIITTLERVFLSGLFFFMMCVAERTYRQVNMKMPWRKKNVCVFVINALSVFVCAATFRLKCSFRSYFTLRLILYPNNIFTFYNI